LRKEISAEEAKTLFGLFRARVKYSPDKVAYRYFDEIRKAWRSLTWKETAKIVARWQAALKKENPTPGDRVGLMTRNRYERVMFELAAFGLGLVTVPFYLHDKPENSAYILKSTDIKLLLIENETQEKALHILAGLRVICLDKIEEWLPEKYDTDLCEKASEPDGLATILHTSGTTGLPKGAMFSHRNILSNAEAAAKTISFYEEDVLVPFTGGYVLSMLMDIAIAFPRSLNDLQVIRPTIIVSAARLYEYAYGQIKTQLLRSPRWMRCMFEYTVDMGWRRFEYQQGRGKWSSEFLLWPLLDMLIAKPVRQIFGGKLRCGFYAGAKLPPEIFQTLVGLGIPIMTCYGQTEAGPVISVNRPDDNIPASVGKPLAGVAVRIEKGELLVKGPGVMTGYWNNPSANQAALDKEGWLHTGDRCSIDADGRIFFIGRMSDIIVTEKGKEISPAEIEVQLTADLLIAQAMVIGKGKPFVAALIVLNKEHWKQLATQLKLNPDDPSALKEKSAEDAVLARITKILGKYSDKYSDAAQIRRVTLLKERWTVEAGLITPTDKLRRANLSIKYADDIEQMYSPVRSSAFRRTPGILSDRGFPSGQSA